MNDALRALAAAAPGSGELSGPAVGVGRAEHPVCGDVVVVSLRRTGDTVDAYAWRASGCPATFAVAAAAHGVLGGCALATVPDALRRRLQALGGLASHEHHAERIWLQAFAAACNQANGLA